MGRVLWQASCKFGPTWTPFKVGKRAIPTIFLPFALISCKSGAANQKRRVNKRWSERTECRSLPQPPGSHGRGAIRRLGPAQRRQCRRRRRGTWERSILGNLTQPFFSEKEASGGVANAGRWFRGEKKKRMGVRDGCAVYSCHSSFCRSVCSWRQGHEQYPG